MFGTAGRFTAKLLCAACGVFVMQRGSVGVGLRMQPILRVDSECHGFASCSAPGWRS
jgi:hypothetical protein